MTRMKRMATLLAVGLSVGGAAAGCSSERHTPEAAAQGSPVRVRAEAVVERTVAGTIELGGTVVARTSAGVAARVVAQVREVRVQAGDRVKTGQVLVVLDGADLAAGSRGAKAAAQAAADGVHAAEAEHRAAEAGLTLARASHGRVQTLETRKSATRQELDEAVAMLAAAESRVKAAEARIAQARQSAQAAGAAAEGAEVAAAFASVTAPFDGVVTERLVEPGAMAMPGVPLVRLDAAGGFRVDVTVDEARLAALEPGAKVEVAVDALKSGAILSGRIDEVARASGVDARAFLVKVGVPHAAGLASGQFARVRVPGPSATALVLPDGALVRRGQVTSVFVVENGVARVRLVDVRGTVVTAGLAGGERVVIAPPADLADGRPVETGGR